MKKKLLYFYCFFMAVFSGYSQEIEPPQFDFNNVRLPTTPSGASLGRYEDIPVDMATGVPSINIPIFSFDIDGLTIPISLSYHASGVQVNDLSSSVGLNWTLNAGGGIFRSVNGIADENGWITTNFGPLSQSFYDSYPNIFSFNYRTAMLGGSSGGGMQEIRDHNPDDYSYNFLGYSGKFITDFANEALKNQADKLEIDFDYTSPVIADQYGNVFSFNGYTEQSFRRYVIGSVTLLDDSNGSTITSSSGEKDYGHVTGWMLSNITTKNNNSISFEYEECDVIDDDIFPVSNTISIGNTCGPWLDSYGFARVTQTNGSGPPQYLKKSYTVQLLTKISTPQINIKFIYINDESLSTWKKKLDKIVIENKHGKLIKEFQFNYGVFNGDARLKLEKVFEKNGNQELPGYSFVYNEANDLPERYSFAQDFFGYYNGKSGNVSLAPYDAEIRNYFAVGGYGNFYDQNTGDRSHDSNLLKTGILENIYYPTGGSTKFSYEANTGFQSNVMTYCGGLRVKTIEDRDHLGVTVKTKNYEYSGLVGLSYETHRFITQIEEYGTDSGGSKTFHSGFVAPKSTFPHGYFYKEVTETQIGSGETHKIKKNFKEDYSYGSLGNLLDSEIFFKDNDTVKIIEYDYGRFGIEKNFTWKVLGKRECGFEYQSHQKMFNTYRHGENMHFYGNEVMLPTRVATTEFFDPFKTPVTTIKTMNYDNETLLMLSDAMDSRYSRIGSHDYVVSNSKSEKISTNYYYSQTPEVVGLPSDFPKGLLLRKEVFNETTGMLNISGQAFEYDNVGNIKNTYRYNKGGGTHSGGPSYVPQNYELDVSYLTDQGKPTQVLGQDGVITSYIWGYNNLYPIAKIVGLGYANIPTATINQLQILTTANPYNESSLIHALNEFRNSYPSAQITTYTYGLMIGVTSITDPKGVQIEYIYDDFGRLEFVKDQEGNILSKNEYRYKN